MKEWCDMTTEERAAARGDDLPAEKRIIMERCRERVYELLQGYPKAKAKAGKVTWGNYLVNAPEVIAAHCLGEAGMKIEDYALEYCPYCDKDVVIHAHGITACSECGKLLAPCTVCHDENGGCHDPCPYGCTGGPEDEFKPVTMPPITPAEEAFFLVNG